MRLVPRGIGSTLFLAFSATALPVIVAVGGLLEWQARRALDRELGRRVESMAVAVSAAIAPQTWDLLFSLGPGEEESRTARHLLGRLERICAETGVARIAVWTTGGDQLLDTSRRLPIGSPAPRAALLAQELEAVARHGTASTPLFRTEAGERMKIGLARILTAGVRPEAAGVLLVEAPPQALDAAAAMRRTLLGAGALGLLLVLVVALWLARGVTERISILAGAARRIGGGDLENPIPALGDDELGFLGVVLDRMRGALRVRERELRAMVGGVAHEIRNPLGGLTLFAEMLARDPGLDPEQSRKAQRILDEALRLERVVSDFLIYARPERPQRARVPLEPVVAESAQNAAAGIEWRGACELAVGTAQVDCDPDHLRQILINLLRNAMQAAGSDGSVRVDAERRENVCDLRVSDSGPGLTEADHERIFEPFYSGKADGAGLGLAIVRRLCELNTIGLRVGASDLGGACFRLRFRRHPSE